MQTQQPHRPLPLTPSPKNTQSAASLQPWVKPTFERVLLNDALAGPFGPPPYELDGSFVYTPVGS